MTQFIGPVKVTIDYSSPAVHGPGGKDRRGQIWGKLVPYGVTDLGFHGGKPSPWRGGANENTIFTVSDPVTIEGQPLAPASMDCISLRDRTNGPSFSRRTPRPGAASSMTKARTRCEIGRAHV